MDPGLAIFRCSSPWPGPHVLLFARLSWMFVYSFTNTPSDLDSSAPHSQVLFRSYAVALFFARFSSFLIVWVQGDLYHQSSGRSAVLLFFSCFPLEK